MPLYPSADVRLTPPLAEPRVGLLASAKRVDLPAGVRWGNGVKWLPELHAPASNAFGARAVKCQMSTVAHTATDKAAVEDAYPFQVYAFDWCTTLDSVGRDWQGRARRLLAATQSKMVAAEFWVGTIAAAEALSNRSLASATDLIGTAYTPAKALAQLDKGLCSALANGPGMIHCTVECLNRLMAAQAIMRDGTAWVTAMGSRVVADAGYTGAVDGQAGEWMVGTSMPEITLGPIEEMNLQTPADWHAAVLESVNDVIVWAQRDVLIVHEPTIVLKASKVDLT